MYRILISESINALSDAITSLGWEVPDEIKVEEPPNPELGDVASSVSFQLAKDLKRSPMEITQEILKVLKIPDIFSKVESKGPYINFYANYNEFSSLVLNSVTEDYGKLESNNTKIIL